MGGGLLLRCQLPWPAAVWPKAGAVFSVAWLERMGHAPCEGWTALWYPEVEFGRAPLLPFFLSLPAPMTIFNGFQPVRGCGFGSTGNGVGSFCTPSGTLFLIGMPPSAALDGEAGVAGGPSW